MSSRKTTVVLAHVLASDGLAQKEVRFALARGGIVAYPTETLYGLAVDPFQEEAVMRLYALKGRPEGMPLSLIVQDLAMVYELVTSIPAYGQRLFERFLPGPLTVVLEARKGIPHYITGGTGKVGIRISSHPAVSVLFRCYRSPLTSTSANPTGQPPAIDVAAIQQYFPEGIDYILDGGRATLMKPSTVIDLTGEQPVVLREGVISSEEICRVVYGDS